MDAPETTYGPVPPPTWICAGAHWTSPDVTCASVWDTRVVQTRVQVKRNEKRAAAEERKKSIDERAREARRQVDSDAVFGLEELGDRLQRVPSQTRENAVAVDEEGERGTDCGAQVSPRWYRLARYAFWDSGVAAMICKGQNMKKVRGYMDKVMRGKNKHAEKGAKEKTKTVASRKVGGTVD